MPFIDFHSDGAPLSGLPNDYYSVIYEGFLHTFTNGSYWVRGSCPSAGCRFFFLGASEDGSVEHVLNASSNYRFKLEFWDSTGTGSVELQWHRGDGDWSVVPTEHLLHSVVCEDECRHGCCVGHNLCSCEPGWAGADCSINMTASCGAPSHLVATAGGVTGEVQR